MKSIVFMVLFGFLAVFAKQGCVSIENKTPYDVYYVLVESTKGYPSNGGVNFLGPLGFEKHYWYGPAISYLVILGVDDLKNGYKLIKGAHRFTLKPEYGNGNCPGFTIYGNKKRGVYRVRSSKN